MSDYRSLPINPAKLHAPQGTPDLINRGRLFDDAPLRTDGTTTLVSAPAGYGKSTFVAQKIADSPASNAWLSLDRADNDLRRFAAHLVAAIRLRFPKLCPKTMAYLREHEVCSSEDLANLLCNDLQSLDAPLILVLDDYHYVGSLDVHEFVGELLRHPIRNLHLVIITRRDPPLPLQSLRAKGRLHEFRMRGLAFTREDTREFLNARLGNQVSDKVVSILHQRTEGWPAGLRLATLAIQDGYAAEAFVDGIPTDTHLVRDYLMQEVLANCTPILREYLLRSSFFDRFCASLCEDLLPEALSDGVDGALALSGVDFIEHIRNAGFFAVGLDGAGNWYRYHPMFRSMLQYQARSELGEAEVRRIHSRAARWFEDHELLDEAVRHLLLADTSQDAADLMVRKRNTIMNAERWHQLDGWLRDLSPDLAAEMPELLLLKARLLRTAGSREEFRQTLDRAESLIESSTIDADLRQELRGSLESGRCFELYMQSDAAGALSAARQALRLLPADSYAERGFALIILGGALQMLGEVGAARDALHAVLSGSGKIGAVPVTLRSRALLALCFVHWMHGDLQALDATSREVVPLAEAAGLQEAGTVAVSFRASVLYHRNQLSAVHESLETVFSGESIANAEFYAQSLIISSLTHQELGEGLAANAVVRSLQDLALTTNNAQLTLLSEAFSAEMAMRQGRPAEALSWAGEFDPEPFTPNYYFFSPHLTFFKVLVSDDSRSTQIRAAVLLDRFIDYLERIHNRRFLIEALALRAVLAEETGKGTAVEDLGRAVKLALPGRWIRLFVDLGPRLASLFHRLDLDAEGLVYVGEILAGYRDEQPRSAAGIRLESVTSETVGLEPLSDREQQIMMMLARRLSNKEISSALNISIVTVKRHTANIYQKLGVHSRRQAVAKAIGLGILRQDDRLS